MSKTSLESALRNGGSVTPSSPSLDELAHDHELLAELKAQVEELRERMTLAERRPSSVKEAAVALGVSEKTVRRMIGRGEIQHRRTGTRVVVYIDRQSALRVSSAHGS